MGNSSDCKLVGEKGMIVFAAHTGAGFIALKSRDRHVKLLKAALKEGVRVYLKTKCLQEAISQIVSVLENDSLTNAGHGGNLTETGKRENEAGLRFMKSIGQVKERGHGAASGLDNILNPVQVAKKIAEEQSRLGIYRYLSVLQSTNFINP